MTKVFADNHDFDFRFRCERTQVQIPIGPRFLNVFHMWFVNRRKMYSVATFLVLRFFPYEISIVQNLLEPAKCLDGFCVIANVRQNFHLVSVDRNITYPQFAVAGLRVICRVWGNLQNLNCETWHFSKKRLYFQYCNYVECNNIFSFA